MSRNKIHTRDASSLDDNSVFYIEITSPAWRSPEKMEIGELAKKVSKHIKLDTNDKESFLLEKFKDQDISYYTPPQNKLEGKPLIAAMDENYLYVWVKKQKKWKRIPLSDWELE